MRGGSGKGEPELEPSHQPEHLLSKAGAQESSLSEVTGSQCQPQKLLPRTGAKKPSLTGQKFPLASKSCLSPSTALKRHRKAKPQHPSRATTAPKPGQFQMPPANLSKEGLKTN